MWSNPQKTANLVTFTEEMLNGKLHFLCSDGIGNTSIPLLRLLVRQSFMQQFTPGIFKLSLQGHIKRIINCNCHAGFLN